MTTEQQPVIVTVDKVETLRCMCGSAPGAVCPYCKESACHRSHCAHCGYPLKSELITGGES